ncbi:MAG: hypothetical protein QUS12_06365 [Methanosarcina sp.]|nr:hypothetical protein [Methanosarcina sp.]
MKEFTVKQMVFFHANYSEKIGTIMLSFFIFFVFLSVRSFGSSSGYLKTRRRIAETLKGMRI